MPQVPSPEDNTRRLAESAEFQPHEPRPEGETEEEVLAALREQNYLLRRWIRDNNNWGLILARGMVMGLGTAIGATVILSLAIWALQPLRAIQPMRDTVDRAVDALQRLERARPGSTRGEPSGSER